MEHMRNLVLVTALLASAALPAQYLVDHTPPKPVDELYKAGEKAYRAGDHRTAIVLFTQVLEIDADHINAYLQRGFCHSLLQAYDKAVVDFTAVVERKPDHAWAYTSRGSAYAKLGKHDLAIADFDRVLAIDPRNEEAFNNRGWARKATGDPAGACQDWKTSQRMGNAEARIILKNNRCK
jgi:tetratricopeptide (TPR) repeat protein